MEIKCNCCEKYIKVKRRPDDMPNIVGFQLKDNSFINICYSCICKASYDKWTLDKIKKLKGE